MIFKLKFSVLFLRTPQTVTQIALLNGSGDNTRTLTGVKSGQMICLLGRHGNGSSSDWHSYISSFDGDVALFYSTGGNPSAYVFFAIASKNNPVIVTTYWFGGTIFLIE